MRLRDWIATGVVLSIWHGRGYAAAQVRVVAEQE